MPWPQPANGVPMAAAMMMRATISSTAAFSRASPSRCRCSCNEYQLQSFRCGCISFLLPFAPSTFRKSLRPIGSRRPDRCNKGGSAPRRNRGPVSPMRTGHTAAESRRCRTSRSALSRGTSTTGRYTFSAPFLRRSSVSRRTLRKARSARFAVPLCRPSSRRTAGE